MDYHLELRLFYFLEESMKIHERHTVTCMAEVGQHFKYEVNVASARTEDACSKVNGYTFRRHNLCHLCFCLPSEVGGGGSTLKDSNLLLGNSNYLLLGNKLFPLRVDPILEVFHQPGTQTGCHKSCCPL